MTMGITSNPYTGDRPLYRDRLAELRGVVEPQTRDETFGHHDVVGVSAADVLALINEADHMRKVLTYCAECVGVQTLDMKNLANYRRESLEAIIAAMLNVADDPHSTTLPYRGNRLGYDPFDTSVVRDRLAADAYRP